MSSEIQAFDAAATPLMRGVNLVEASAGTGKTYALAMLVLRFIVEQDIPVDRILVVTFTHAATEELRGRIRARLFEARAALSGAGAEGDATLIQWLAGVEDQALAALRLEQALLDMDRAPVLTIHSFCQRMLREQALDTGQLFDAQLLADTRQVVQEVVEDYWRRQLYDLSPEECAPLLAAYPTPAALHASVNAGGAVWDRIEPASLSVADGLAAYATARQGLSIWWGQQQDRLRGDLQEALQNSLFKKPMAADFSEWWQSIDDFCHGRTPLLPAGLTRLGQEGMLACLNGSKIRSAEKRLDLVADWALPESEVAACESAIHDLLLAFRGNLVHGLREQVSQGLLRRNRLGFDDLITLLAAALSGPRGGQLQELIGERFQAALIDEFQDTDHRQYQIFSTLFANDKHHHQQQPKHYLYLIGDPKQAIYRFRGADIHAYYQAREAADCQLGLGHNYRSHPGLVAAVNRLFAEQMTPFHPVAPARTVGETGLSRSGLELPPLVCCRLPDKPLAKNGRWSSGQAREQIIEALTREISTLLVPEPPVLLGGSEDGARLGPRDIAILVRSHSQGQACYEALIRAGIPAVLTSRDSVFLSSECRELAQVLRALCAPGDPDPLKAAMACSWFGLSGVTLHALWQDGGGSEVWLERFQGYWLCWQEQGFLVMMGRLLAEERVFENLARLERSERRITNINHLLELIHAVVEDEGLAPAQLLQWLAQVVDGEGASPDQSELRLESDERAVRIVTVHGAKGLQYSVVFCPFLWQRSQFDASSALVCQAPDGGRILDIGSPAFAARQEQQLEDDWSEELRLVYVALTRAVSRCYLYWVDLAPRKPVVDSRETPLAAILGLQGLEDGQDQGQRLEKLTAELGGEFQLLDLDLGLGQVPATLLVSEAAEDLVCRTCHRTDLGSGWRLHSYSSLAHLAFHESDESELEPESAPLSGQVESAGELVPEITEEPESTLPAGPGFGNLIHGLLEEVPFIRLAQDRLSDERLLDYCRRFQQSVEIAPLRTLLVRLTTTPLLASATATAISASSAPSATSPLLATQATDTSDSFMLSQLADTDCLHEMPFTLHLHGGSTARLNALLAGQPTVRPVQPQALRGYLTGFIDLICRWQGRYYLVDYKSNRLDAASLAPGLSTYAPESLLGAMREHNYGLQYWLYSLILHNYLGQTLVDYSHARHFGGVCYLFVRGMDPAVPGSGVYFDRPPEKLLDQLHTVMTGGEE